MVLVKVTSRISQSPKIRRKLNTITMKSKGMWKRSLGTTMKVKEKHERERIYVINYSNLCSKDFKSSILYSEATTVSKGKRRFVEVWLIDSITTWCTPSILPSWHIFSSDYLPSSYVPSLHTWLVQEIESHNLRHNWLGCWR